MNEQLVIDDMNSWMINHVEKNHSFYGHDMPPCPYAKAARLKGLVDTKVYNGEGPIWFIKHCVEDLMLNKDKGLTTRIIAFPKYFKWLFHIKWFVKWFNNTTVPCDYYLQYGRVTARTGSGTTYFVVIVNKLSAVMDGHKSLSKTSYYDNWSKKHYDAVVVRRQKIYDKYNK